MKDSEHFLSQRTQELNQSAKKPVSVADLNHLCRTSLSLHISLCWQWMQRSSHIFVTKGCNVGKHKERYSRYLYGLPELKRAMLLSVIGFLASPLFNRFLGGNRNRTSEKINYLLVLLVVLGCAVHVTSCPLLTPQARHIHPTPTHKHRKLFAYLKRVSLQDFVSRGYSLL